jgi:hypothetical protein
MPQRSTYALRLLAVLVFGACGGNPENAAPSVAPQLIVEQFLRAVNGVFEQSDAQRNVSLETMGRLFGTRDGPIIGRDPRKEVEQRMYALASILRHDDYNIQEQQIVPGRREDAIRLLVRMKFGERQVPVPYTMVRTARSSWLIEQIDVEPITSRP